MTEREMFEQWISTRKLCKKYGAKLDLLPDGLHRDVRVRGHFSTWQAARATQPQVPDGMALVPLDALQEVIRISDREHPAWDAVKAAIAASQGDQA